MGTRRGLLAIGGAAALIGAVQYGPGLWRRVLPPPLDLRPLAEPPGFRWMAGGATSGGGGFDIFAGLDARPAAPPLPPEQFCDALYGGMAPAPGRVRIAYFTDYFCPYCRVLDALLADVAATDARIAITRHEVPLLGPSSVEAARASLSADALGAGAAVRARMIATPFRPTDGYLRRTAADAGIDADRLLAGMDAPDVTRRMETSEAVFRRFGFAGTPGLVVGTTAVNGAVDAATLRRLVDLEAETPPAC